TCPIRDAAGHDDAPSTPNADCAGEHACKPEARPGLIDNPSGNTTDTFFTFASASPRSLSKPSCGTRRSTPKPAGASARVVPGASESDGSNARRPQPDKPAGAPLASRVTSEPLASASTSCQLVADSENA